MTPSFKQASVSKPRRSKLRARAGGEEGPTQCIQRGSRVASGSTRIQNTAVPAFLRFGRQVRHVEGMLRHYEENAWIRPLAHSYRTGLVLSPFQNPINSPVSPTQSLTFVTACFAIPDCVLLLLCLVRPGIFADGSMPGLINELPCPVAYSDPMLGSTFSPALRLTNRAKGTSHTFIPKNDAISVNEGTFCCS